MKRDKKEQETEQEKEAAFSKFSFPKKRKKEPGLRAVDGESKNDQRPMEKEDARRIHGKFVLAIVVVVVIVVVFSGFSNTNYNGYEVVEETSVKNASMIDYIPYQDSLLKYSKDGAIYVNEKGGSVWNETFAMKMPKADVSGEYVVVADLNGNDVYIFNTAGKVSSTTMPYKICDVAVASQGVFAVILEGEKENFINIYDKNGELISKIQTTIDKSGYPMDIDLSEDGTKLFSTYLYLDGADVKNGMAAYNFGAVGQSENADRMMGAYQLDNTIVPKVEFLDNNTICAFGDNQFLIYSMREKPSEKAKIEFDVEVQSIVYNSSYVGIVIPNAEENKKDGEKAPYVLELYNTNGRSVLKQKIDFAYENVRMSEDEIIFTGGSECRIYTIKGQLKFSYSFQKNVVDMVPTGYSKRYIVLYDSGSEVIKIKHESKKE